MYLVREKSSKKILHVNPAPVSQGLEAQDVYFEFNEKTMEIGKTDTAVPDAFNINEHGEIVESTLQEKINQGIVKILPEEKIVDEQLVTKTIQEQVDEGLISLEPHEKVQQNKVVEMTMIEQIDAGVFELKDNQKIVNNEIVEITAQEMFEQGLITLETYKQQTVAGFSTQALEQRNTILPDYKIQNAMLGIYDDKKIQDYKKIIESFRDEFYRLKEQIEKCETITAIDKVTENFPTTLLGADQSKTKKIETKKKDDSVKNKKNKDKKTKTKKK